MFFKFVTLIFSTTLILSGCTTKSTETNVSQNSPKPAARAVANAQELQQSADDLCFVSYSQSAGRCNSQHGNNDAAFNQCLAPVKADLSRCCENNDGSATCDENAGVTPEQRNVDGQCFLNYTRSAGRCNDSAGQDDRRFTSCLGPVKTQLVRCCQNGGSATCADNAQ
jgi:hypothetical protein